MSSPTHDAGAQLRRVVYIAGPGIDRVARWAFPPADDTPAVVHLQSPSGVAEAKWAVPLTPLEAHLVVQPPAETSPTNAEAAVRALDLPGRAAAFTTVHAVWDASPADADTAPADIRVLLGVHDLFAWDIPAERIVTLADLEPDRWPPLIRRAHRSWPRERWGIRLPDQVAPWLVEHVISSLRSPERRTELFAAWGPEGVRHALNPRLHRTVLVTAVGSAR